MLRFSQGLALHHPTQPLLWPCDGQAGSQCSFGSPPKDTEPPAQGPSRSRTRARIDFQMSSEKQADKSLTLFTKLPGIVSHGDAQGRAVQAAELLITCLHPNSLLGGRQHPDLHRDLAECREQGTGRKEGARGKDLSR